MDGERFDSLTRRFAARSTRRTALRGLLVAAAGAVDLSGSGAAAQTKRPVGAICRTNGDCASGLCGPRDATGRERCQCVSGADCPQPAAGNPCHVAACTAGVCGLQANVGAACDDGNACTANDACTAAGACVGTPITCPVSENPCKIAGCDPAAGCTLTEVPEGGDCESGNLCTADTCKEGVCTQGPDVVTPTCPNPSQCQVSVSCNPATGRCDQIVNKGTGTACGTGPSCVDGTQHAQDTCDGNGACVPGANTDCGLYLCGETACLTTCTDDDQCVGSAHCDGGVCQGDLANGEACDENSDCQSGICNATNGVCCSQTCGDGVGCVGSGTRCDDNPNCGGPGQACCAGNACDNGSCSDNFVCEPCGEEQYQPCCTNDANIFFCNNGLICPSGDRHCWPTTCGGANEACCDGTRCHNGLACDANQICQVLCGDLGEPCCAGGICNSGNFCFGPTCIACGGNQQSCCAGEVCDAGLTCGVSFSGTGTQCVGSCGGQGDICCHEGGNPVCDAGFRCDENARCVNNCGGPGQACCLRNACDSGACSIDMICEPCGGQGEPCCFNDANIAYCNNGLVCPDRTCVA